MIPPNHHPIFTNYRVDMYNKCKLLSHISRKIAFLIIRRFVMALFYSPHSPIYLIYISTSLTNIFYQNLKICFPFLGHHLICVDILGIWMNGDKHWLYHWQNVTLLTKLYDWQFADKTVWLTNCWQNCMTDEIDKHNDYKTDKKMIDKEMTDKKSWLTKNGNFFQC